MSQATQEEIAAENAMYDRLTFAVTEALTTLPTKDLQSWNFRAGLFTQVDRIINDVLESGKGRPANWSVLPLFLALSHRVAAPRTHQQEGLRRE
jgi:hypothetical protein